MNQPAKIDFAIGGQALIEGVMMRSPHYVTAAVRKKDGTIKTRELAYSSLATRSNFFKTPILRGVVNLIEMMFLGMKMLNFSAEEFAQDGEEEKEKGEKKSLPKKDSKWFDAATMVFSFIISFAIAIFMFKFIPLYTTEWLRSNFPFIADNYVIFNLIEGLIRIAIFILYIFVLSLFKSFHRIFEYHGAEHMAVHAYEKGAALTPENVKKEHPEHPRCGTSFLVAVFIVSIIVYSLVPRNPEFLLNLTQRILVIPLIAGIGYEVLKWSAKHREHPLMKLVVFPGLLTQKITTQQPDEKQIEVAITALQKALALEKEIK